MSLLDVITKTASNPESSTDQSKYPIVLNSDDIILKLKPKDEEETPSLDESSSIIKRVGGWKSSKADMEIIESGNKFVQKLKRKLKNAKSFDRSEFLGLLMSFLDKCSDKKISNSSVDVAFPLSEYRTRLMVQKLGLFLGGEVLGLVFETCLSLEVWDVLETLIREGLVGRLFTTNLIEGIVEKKRSDLLCLWVKNASHIRSTDFLSILKYFLNPTKATYSTMLNVRNEWEKEALIAVEKASEQQISVHVSSLAKRASLLLMVAYDGFSSSELCLHYLFGSSNVDELALSYCITRLEGSEMLKLVCYLGKWLRKYEKFTQVGPCPEAASTLELKSCDFVPSLESIIKCLSLIVDDRFSSLVLNSEFHDELKSIGEVVKSLISEASLYCTLADLVENVRCEVRPSGGNV